MNAMQQVTRVMPKDCLVEENLISFLVPEKLMGKAIGKGAVNIKELQEKMKKRIELVPFFEKAEDTFANAMEVNFTASKINGSKLVITLDSNAKAKAFKNNSRIKRVKEFIFRNFALELIVN